MIKLFAPYKTSELKRIVTAMTDISTTMCFDRPGFCPGYDRDHPNICKFSAFLNEDSPEKYCPLAMLILEINLEITHRERKSRTFSVPQRSQRNLTPTVTLPGVRVRMKIEKVGP